MFSVEELVHLLHIHYGVEVKEVKELPGYEDLNYLVDAASGERCIVKISTESNVTLLQAQADMIEHLVKKGMTGVFPEHLQNKKSELITSLHGKKNSFLRVVKFLPGTFYAELKKPSEKLHADFGSFLGKMDASLTDFYHPGAHRYFDWDIQYALDWEKNIHLIEEPEDRRLADYFLLQFKENVLPEIRQLRKAVIHNDANDWNVLTDGDKITGLIDFGDLVFTPLVNNLAIALTYVLLDKDNPLEIAVQVVAAYHQENILKEKELDLLYYLIAARLCISVVQSATRKAEDSTNQHHFLTENQAWKLLHQWIKINPLKVAHNFRLACQMKGCYDKSTNYEELLSERKTHIGRNLSISYQKNLKIIKGAFQYLYDDKGNTYVDCVNNVSHVGHCHPQVVRAMQKQIATLNTNTRYLHDNLEEYAKALLETLPRNLKVCYFTNSGSEANDLAIRMARHFTGQKDVIVLDHAYHGTSTLAIEMSPYKFDGKGGFPQPDYIHKAQNPDTYRGPFKGTDAGKRYAEDVQRIIAELQKKGKSPAAFICETLLGVGGQIPLPDNYLKEAYAHVRKAGGVVVADEVQVGFGRVGSKFWGFELQGVEPDIVVLGKPIGNGHPMAAVVVTEEIADAFNNEMEYFNTFGGNPVSMATGLAVLKTIQEEELQKNALEVGDYLLRLLKELGNKSDFIGDVRGRGLFVGVEFIKDIESLKPEVDLLNNLIEEMKDQGYLLSTDGPLNNVLKIKPPLVFSKQNAKELMERIEEVLEKNIA